MAAGGVVAVFSSRRYSAGEGDLSAGDRAGGVCLRARPPRFSGEGLRDGPESSWEGRRFLRPLLDPESSLQTVILIIIKSV